MADMLTIGTSALHAFRKSLEVTSHNVANIGTEGYSRQRAEIHSLTNGGTSVSFNGSGSKVNTIERVYSDYVQKQLLSANSSVKGYKETLSYARHIEGALAGSESGIQEFMHRYFDALQTAADNPTSRVARQQVIDEANNLSGHIDNLSVVLHDAQMQVNNQVKDLTRDINQQLEIIQSLNEQVMRAEAQGYQPPNDLYDQREQAIMELSDLVEVKVYNQPNGTIDIHSVNGKVPLLSDNTLTRIHADLSPYPGENRVEVYAQSGGQQIVVSDFLIGGGQLGGLLDFRKNLLDEAELDLGVTLNAFVAANNWQHYMGFDENGNAGTNIYKPLEATGVGHKDNSKLGGNVLVTFNPTNNLDLINGANTIYASGQPSTYDLKEQDLAAAYKAIGEMKPDNYEMRFDGKKWTVTNMTTKDTATFNQGDFVMFEGLRFEADPGTGMFANGDSFIVKPHEAILNSFQSELRDREGLATRGQDPMDLNTVGPAGEGDNVNIANMASLLTKKVMYSNHSGEPSETLMGGYTKMAVSAGTFIKGAETLYDSAVNTFDYVLERRESISGVNLDEEAANLMRFIEAYQAAAQIMQASQTLFQTLLGAVRG